MCSTKNKESLKSARKVFDENLAYDVSFMKMFLGQSSGKTFFQGLESLDRWFMKQAGGAKAQLGDSACTNSS